MVTGETFETDLYEKVLKLIANVQIVNAYGPAECSDDVTHWVGSGQLPSSLTTVPIGHPIRNTKVYVVDTNLRSLPVGVPGEIVVTGTGVGRGYINDPDRTEAAFVELTFERGEPPVVTLGVGCLGETLSFWDEPIDK